MNKFLLAFFFLMGAVSLPGICEEIEIDSSVLNIDPVQEYFIIKGGRDMGIEIGDGLIVHRSGEKIAEGYIIEVRSIVSAAEILTKEPGKKVQEGDDVLMVKEKCEEKSVEQKQEKPKKSIWATILGTAQHPKEKPQTSKWTPILGVPTTYKQVAISSPGAPISETKEPGAVRRGSIQGDMVGIIIPNSKNAVFSYALMVLRENGYSIMFSNRSEGIISASKPINLPITRELWADMFAVIDHKIVLSLEMRDKSGSTEVIGSCFKEHFQKERQVRRYITKESKEYSDLIAIISKIKERSGFEK